MTVADFTGSDLVRAIIAAAVAGGAKGHGLTSRIAEACGCTKQLVDAIKNGRQAASPAMLAKLRAIDPASLGPSVSVDGLTRIHGPVPLALFSSAAREAERTGVPLEAFARKALARYVTQLRQTGDTPLDLSDRGADAGERTFLRFLARAEDLAELSRLTGGDQAARAAHVVEALRRATEKSTWVAR